MIRLGRRRKIRRTPFMKSLNCNRSRLINFVHCYIHGDIQHHTLPSKAVIREHRFPLTVNQIHHVLRNSYHFSKMFDVNTRQERTQIPDTTWFRKSWRQESLMWLRGRERGEILDMGLMNDPKSESKYKDPLRR